jgi:ribosomal protein S18 acetylase RimI-like enzyme
MKNYKQQLKDTRNFSVKRIELLNKSHNRGLFDCGSEALNQYLQTAARQHTEKGVSRTFISTDSEDPKIIIAFFTLAICEIYANKLPPNLAKKYPLQVPGVKLARLAVDKKSQRQGIGEILVFETIKRAYIISENVGIIGLFVDAKDELASNYYQQFGFTSLADNPLEMFLPLQTIREILADHIT